MRPITILIVEDDPVCRKALASNLEAYFFGKDIPCEILTAENSTKALTIINHLGFDFARKSDSGIDLAFVDFHLPDYKGSKLSQFLQDREKFSSTIFSHHARERVGRTPIIGITADTKLRKNKQLRNFTDVLEKPITPGALEAVLEKYLDAISSPSRYNFQ